MPIGYESSLGETTVNAACICSFELYRKLQPT